MTGLFMKRFLLLLLTAALALAPAGSFAEGGEPATVVCSFYPIRILAENVLVDVPGVRLETLAPAGTGCLHDFQLMTGDLKKLDGALCLIINGAGMEQNFLPLLTRERAELPLVDCSGGIELLSDGGEENPHIWLSPFLAARMTLSMGQRLAELLPDEKARILENAERYAGTLTRLGEEMRDALKAYAGRYIVTFHEAFPYFAGAMGLQVLASVTVEPDETPSPRMIAQTVSLVRDAGGCPLFSEPGVHMDALNVIARETRAPVYELNPVTDGPVAPDAYEQAMRENLAVLLKAFGE